jgi:hypothetical protein
MAFTVLLALVMSLSLALWATYINSHPDSSSQAFHIAAHPLIPRILES